MQALKGEQANGREMPVGDSACIELKLPNPNGVSVASAPPTTTAITVWAWITLAAPVSVPLRAMCSS